MTVAVGVAVVIGVFFVKGGFFGRHVDRHYFVMLVFVILFQCIFDVCTESESILGGRSETEKNAKHTYDRLFYLGSEFKVTRRLNIKILLSVLSSGHRVEELHGQLTLRSRKILRNKEESQHDCWTPPCVHWIDCSVNFRCDTSWISWRPGWMNVR